MDDSSELWLGLLPHHVSSDLGQVKDGCNSFLGQSMFVLFQDGKQLDNEQELGSHLGSTEADLNRVEEQSYTFLPVL